MIEGAGGVRRGLELLALISGSDKKSPDVGFLLHFKAVNVELRGLPWGGRSNTESGRLGGRGWPKEERGEADT